MMNMRCLWKIYLNYITTLYVNTRALTKANKANGKKKKL